MYLRTMYLNVLKGTFGTMYVRILNIIYVATKSQLQYNITSQKKKKKKEL